jgi:hypothetical protein
MDANNWADQDCRGWILAGRRDTVELKTYAKTLKPARYFPPLDKSNLSNLTVEFQSLALPTSLLTAFSISCGRTFKAGVLSSLYFSRTCFKLSRSLRSSCE